MRLLTLGVLLTILTIGSRPMIAQTSDPSQAAPPVPSQRIDSVQAPPGEEKSSQWTIERLQRAKQKPIPIVDPGKKPKSSETKNVEPRREESAPAQNSTTGTKASGNSYAIPLRYAGKLFYTQPDGDYVCSAQFIAPNVVLTAAHCVRDSNTGRFYTNFLFALQYNKGGYSHLYKYTCASTLDGWIGSNYRWDYAMLRVDAPSSTGYFGWRYGWPMTTYIRAPKIGYPGAITNGQVIQVDSGPLFLPTDEPWILGLRHGNRRNAEGSSGGAWIGQFTSSPGKGNYVISVTSHHRGNNRDISYGPLFDQNFKNLLEYTSGGCR